MKRNLLLWTLSMTLGLSFNPAYHTHARQIKGNKLENSTKKTRLFIANDETLAEEICQSGVIHRPLKPDVTRSIEARNQAKTVLDSMIIGEEETMNGWSKHGRATLRYGRERSVKGTGAIRLSFANETGQRARGQEGDRDYATYGNAGVSYYLGGKNLEAYNRIAVWIYPDCPGTRVVNMNLSFYNDWNKPRKEGYRTPTGNHLINLTNGQWNYCILEVADLQRDCIQSLSWSTSLRGMDDTMGDSCVFYFDNLQLQRVEETEKTVGWIPAEGRISYSMSGYLPESNKRAIVHPSTAKEAGNIFSVIDTRNGKAVYKGTVKEVKNDIGNFAVLDFDKVRTPGTYVIQVGKTCTRPFIIGERMWDDSQWRVLNYIFCQRCGYAVPGIHGKCHEDLVSTYDGRTISYGGGWHDAGDLSQQTLQTGDVAFSLLEACQSVRKENPLLAARLREEALWGLDFVLKNRYGDGTHASSMGLLIWLDGQTGTKDDINSVRTQAMAFDNFLYAAYEAYASTVLDEDPALQQHLYRIAKEDFDYAIKKFEKDGFEPFPHIMEHSYNTSPCQYMATISWSASQLYRLTGEERYADLAREYINHVLECQQTEPLGGQNAARGFFYRDKERKSIVHFIHQSRDQIYMQALDLLCATQPKHPDHTRWTASMRLYGDYLKGLMSHTAPYGMVPNGIYRDDEYKDYNAFNHLHIFAPDNAAELYTAQLKRGVKIDDHHYVKRFPVWFGIFNGNTAVHLSTGKAAAICGRRLKDKELREIGLSQLYWTVGQNPFAQSLIYGEGHDYPQMSSFSSGEMTGEMPVGIRTIGNEDTPYWPQINNACYKEVWVTSAGKWLSLLAEYGTENGTQDTSDRQTGKHQ